MTLNKPNKEKVTPVLVTGAAGFIGYHVAARLLACGYDVVGVDNMTPYYDVTLKQARLQRLQQQGIVFEQLDTADAEAMAALFARWSFAGVVHLAAQAGVRYSLENPQAYVHSNLDGFLPILEGCRHNGVQHLVFASSSSVYGANRRLPFRVQDNVDHPVSLYAATKKANELMAHSYAHLYQLPCSGLRFFTVYGPWGRPDMALFKFTRAMLAGEPIEVYNHGRMQRDFTYIDDVVEGVVRLLERPPQCDSDWNGYHPDPATSAAPYRVFNIGNDCPEELETVIGLLEQELGLQARKHYLPLQPGDVPATAAEVSALYGAVGFAPRTPIAKGIKAFVRWYRDYYGC